MTTTWGAYFQLDCHTNTQVDSPLQPQLYTALIPPANTTLHGVLFTGGSFVTTTIDPVVTTTVNEYLTATVESPFQSPGFYPPIPFALHTAETISRSEATRQWSWDNTTARAAESD